MWQRKGFLVTAIRRSDEKLVQSRGSLLLPLSRPAQFLVPHQLTHFALCENTVGIQLSAFVSVGVEI